MDGFLSQAERRCRPRDRALLRELALGTVRWLRRLDHVLSIASERPLREIDPALVGVLRLAVYQLLFLDRVPSHAAVDEAVKQARARTHRGGAGFVNGVLRRVARQRDLASWPVELQDPVKELAVRWSHPDLLVRRWLERLGAEATEQLLEVNNRPRGAHLLSFSDRGGPERLAERLRSEGCEVAFSDLAPMGLRVLSGRPWATAAFEEGEFYVQDEASQLSALLPMPSAGECVLDVAAAPGGKSFSLLAVEPDLSITLLDISMRRTARIRENLRRLRRTARLLIADGARPALRATFDRVILDLPCSGSGTLRKHPELKWRISEAEIERLSESGRRLVRAAAGLVKKGGYLVVISCSLEPEENEAVVDSVLETERGFRRFALEDSVSATVADCVEGPGLWRLWTADEHDGFTVQVLERHS